MSEERKITPDLNDEIRARALQKGVRYRRARADFKGRITAGELSFDEAVEIARADPVLSRIRVRDFLKAFRAIGETKSRRIMRELSIAESKRVGGLGERQREALSDFFREHEAKKRRRAG